MWKSNVTNAANCMTRLRLTVASESGIDDEKIKDIEGVLGLVHDKENYYVIPLLWNDFPLHAIACFD